VIKILKTLKYNIIFANPYTLFLRDCNGVSRKALLKALLHSREYNQNSLVKNAIECYNQENNDETLSDIFKKFNA